MVLLSFCSGGLALASPRAEQQKVADRDPFGWEHIESIARPRAFWWWLGSSVSKPEIDRQLQSLKEAGFGGLLVCPLYEYNNPVLPPIRYLSEQVGGNVPACLRPQQRIGSRHRYDHRRWLANGWTVGEQGPR